MARSQFLGSQDPNAIILGKIFSNRDLRMVTPFRTVVEDAREELNCVVLEGENEVLRIFEDHRGTFERGGWRQGNPLFDSAGELWFFKERSRSDFARVQLHVFDLWYELSKDFEVSNTTNFILIRDGKLEFEYACDLLEIESVQSRIILPTVERVRKEATNNSLS